MTDGDFTQQFAGTGTTVQTCVKTCRDNGYSYAGLQNGYFTYLIDYYILNPIFFVKNILIQLKITRILFPLEFI